jgi:DNA-binding MarR family transcriptional regulator
MVSRLQQEIKQTKPFSSLKQEVLLSIARTAAVLQHASEQALKAHGITLTQYNVLRILRGAGEKGLCRHEIASRLITPVPDVSRLLDRMVRAGLVTRTRDKHDRRLVASCITHARTHLAAVQEHGAGGAGKTPPPARPGAGPGLRPLCRTRHSVRKNLRRTMGRRVEFV